MENVTVNSTRRSIVRICIDGFANYDFYGRVESPLLGSISFRGIMDLISRLEKFYNDIKFPQSAFQLRSFRDSSKNKKKIVSKPIRKTVEEYTEESGMLATFTVHVMFRQNATWQGTVRWMEKACECKFQSTLELLRLMESALAHTEDAIPITWRI